MFKKFLSRKIKENWRSPTVGFAALCVVLTSFPWMVEAAPKKSSIGSDCAVEDLTSQQVSAEREIFDLSPAVRVNFEDGRFVIVQGYNHGVLDPRVSTLSDPRLINSTNYVILVEQILKRFETTVRQLKPAVEMIRRLATSGSIGYLALERRPGDSEAWGEELRKLVVTTKENFPIVGLTENIRQDLILSQFGASDYLKVFEPSVLKSVDILNLEDDQIAADGAAILSSMNQSWPRLMLLLDSDKATQKAVIDFFKREAMNATEVMTTTVAQFQTKAAEILPSIADAHTSSVLTEVLELDYAFRRNAFLRNEAMAKQLIQQKKSGVLLVGTTHVSGLRHIFKNYCRPQGSYSAQASIDSEKP